MMGSGVRVPSAAPLSYPNVSKDIRKGFVYKGFGDTGLSDAVQPYPIRYPQIGGVRGGIAETRKTRYPQMPLSDARIRSLQPRERQYKVADFDGLLIIVKPNGSRLWHFKYRIEGREKLLSFGAYPAVSLAQARKARDAARADLAAGVDPGEAKQEKVGC